MNTPLHTTSLVAEAAIRQTRRAEVKVNETCDYTFHVDSAGDHTRAYSQCNPRLEMDPFNVDDEPYCRFCGRVVFFEEVSETEEPTC